MNVLSSHDKPKTTIRYTLVNTGDDEKAARFAAWLRRDGDKWDPLSVKQWAECIASDKDSATLAADFSKVITEVNYRAFFFETKGASSLSWGKQFEFVLIDSPYLSKFAEANPDPYTFGEIMNEKCKDSTACAFPSLSVGTTLIAPRMRPSLSSKVYSHLGAFLRGAPKEQIASVWKLAAEQYLKRLKEDQEKAVWFSTDGSGVAWLHLRLDPRPKYYSYKPFRTET